LAFSRILIFSQSYVVVNFDFVILSVIALILLISQILLFFWGGVDSYYHFMSAAVAADSRHMTVIIRFVEQILSAFKF